MKTLQLEAKKRIISGRKVKNLRKDGILPATIYGKTTYPLTIQVSTDEYIHVFKQSGETGLISLMIDGVSHPVLVKNLQIDPVTSAPLHIEFHQVNLKEKIRANVPITTTGESLAIKEKVGILLQLLDEIEVEALPTDLPEHIEIDISKLTHVNDHMLVKELILPEKVTLLTDMEIMVIKIGELLAPEPEPVATPVEGETVEAVSGAEGKEEQWTEEKKDDPEKSEEPSKKE